MFAETLDLFAAPEREIVRLRRAEIHYVPQFLKAPPRVPAAVLRIPRQTFDSPEQLAFARKLTYNPWHTIAEHRPLGNQSRARKRMYYELSRLRQEMNNVEHYEPTGDETF